MCLHKLLLHVFRALLRVPILVHRLSSWGSANELCPLLGGALRLGRIRGVPCDLPIAEALDARKHGRLARAPGGQRRARASTESPT